MKRALFVLFVAVMALKVAVATHLQLFGDEAFYWSCSRHLDIAYSDHPFMTALLVRGGTALLGDTPLGVRCLFLLCGALLVPAVYALARRFTDERGAALAAAIALVLPLPALGTLVAVPDAPLLLFGVLALLATERATRTGSLLAWLAAGLSSALALCTHYRAALVPASVVAYLLLTRAGRAQWRTAGPWLALPVVLAGLLPVLIFNQRLHWAPFIYQLSARHASARGPIAWLRHPLEQALVVTPLLYVALLFALLLAVRRARAGDDRAALLACFALLPLGTFFLASPITDTSHDFFHWPQIGYLPLLPLLPEVLAGWWRRGPLGRALAVAAPVLAASVLLLVLADSLVGVPGLGLQDQFRGWSELAAAVTARLPAAIPDPPAAGSAAADAQPAADPRPLIVADNYRAAAELQFLLHNRADIYVLDHPLNTLHGRALQYRIWNQDERALPALAGEPALVVMETSETRFSEREAWKAHVTGLFDDLQPRGELRGAGGVRDFTFFEARIAAR